MTDSPMGVLVRALLADRAVRLLLVEATAPAEHTRRVHGLGPGAARLGAEAVVAAALSSAHIKGEEQLTLQIQGEAPRCGLYADITAEGAIRVRVTPSDLRLGAGGALTGILVAIKSVGPREVYRGITEIAGVTLERALGEHLGTSTQVDAILRVGCVQGPDGRVTRAGGLLLERLPEEPGLPSLPHAAFEERYGWVRDADLSDLLTEAAFGALRGERIEVLEKRPLVWQCRCTVERIEATLIALGAETLQTLIDEDHGAEITCNFCEQVVRVSEARLAELKAQAAPDA